MTTAAHEQSTTLHIREHIPTHPERTSDPYYFLFNRARKHLEETGQLHCWIGNADCSKGPIELHHNIIEFCLSPMVDISKFITTYPEIGVQNEEDFKKWVEGWTPHEDEHNPHQLLPLCKIHHTGILGVHVLPGPWWLPQKFCKAGARPAEKISA